MRPIIAIAVLLIALPGSASAADPEGGKLSTASPSVTWSGSLQNPYLLHNLFNYEPTAGTTGTLPCEAPMCDTFTLDVADSADLKIEVVSEQTEDMSLRIQSPDGEWQYHAGWGDGTKPTKVTYKKAKPGTYVINIVARVFGTTQPTAVTDTADYKGMASLAVAPAPVAAPVVVTPPSTSAPAAKPAAPKPASSSSSAKKRKAACLKKARKIKKAKKRKAAVKKCSKKARR